MKKLLFATIALACASCANQSQSITQDFSQFLTDPYQYVAYRTGGDLQIDGRLDEPSWVAAPYTENFADISGEGFPTPRFATRAKILWDDDYLYVGAELEEPDVWGTITDHDAVIFHDPDFEVFIDPDDDAQNYYEIETNVLGTVFDLFVQKPYRAPSRAYVTFSWDTPGLQVATQVDGTLNDNRDTDKGWTIEMAIPRKAFAAEFDNNLKAGGHLRVGFSRVEWQTEKGDGIVSQRKKDDQGNLLPEDNWTWPSTGQIAMHMPERWAYVHLSDKNVGEGEVTDHFDYPADYNERKLLWAMFYEQERQWRDAGSYHAKLKDFHLTPAERDLLQPGSSLKVEATAHKYEITVTHADGSTISIDENGLIGMRRAK